MKVLCMDMSNPKMRDLLKPEHFLEVGQTYTVTRQYFDESDGHWYYFIAERNDIKPVCSYRAYRFAVIVDPTPEKELQELTEEQADERILQSLCSKAHQT